MKLHKIVCLLFFIFFLACDDNDDEVNPAKSTIQPEWTEGFPLITPGSTTVQIQLQTKQSSMVHYVISNQKLALTPHELVEESAKPRRESITHHGIVETAVAEPLVQNLDKLKQTQKYYGYFLAAPEAGVSEETRVTELEFKTHPRQDTAQFHSASEARTVDYLLYRPEEAFVSAEKKYPIIFYLGGYGERAQPGKRINVIQNGLLPEYIHKGNDVPMLVMSIQHTAEVWQNEIILEAMQHAMNKYPVDKTRVYLVGSSAGAFGVWGFAQEHADKLTAIVPISGGGDPDKACEMKDLAVWGFTNKNDDLVPPARTITMINAMSKCPSAGEAKLMVFPDKGHDCWRRIFDRNHPDWSKSPKTSKVNIYEWLLRQSRPTAN